ncbi:hypothetical protein [Thermaerobacter litoralis]
MARRLRWRKVPSDAGGRWPTGGQGDGAGPFRPGAGSAPGPQGSRTPGAGDAAPAGAGGRIVPPRGGTGGPVDQAAAGGAAVSGPSLLTPAALARPAVPFDPRPGADEPAARPRARFRASPRVAAAGSLAPAVQPQPEAPTRPAGPEGARRAQGRRGPRSRDGKAGPRAPKAGGGSEGRGTSTGTGSPTGGGQRHRDAGPLVEARRWLQDQFEAITGHETGGGRAEGRPASGGRSRDQGAAGAGGDPRGDRGRQHPHEGAAEGGARGAAGGPGPAGPRDRSGGDGDGFHRDEQAAAEGPMPPPVAGAGGLPGPVPRAGETAPANRERRGPEHQRREGGSREGAVEETVMAGMGGMHPWQVAGWGAFPWAVPGVFGAGGLPSGPSGTAAFGPGDQAGGVVPGRWDAAGREPKGGWASGTGGAMAGAPMAATPAPTPVLGGWSGPGAAVPGWAAASRAGGPVVPPGPPGGPAIPGGPFVPPGTVTPGGSWGMVPWGAVSWATGAGAGPGAGAWGGWPGGAGGGYPDGRKAGDQAGTGPRIRRLGRGGAARAEAGAGTPWRPGAETGGGARPAGGSQGAGRAGRADPTPQGGLGGLEALAGLAGQGAEGQGGRDGGGAGARRESGPGGPGHGGGDGNGFGGAPDPGWAWFQGPAGGPVFPGAPFAGWPPAWMAAAMPALAGWGMGPGGAGARAAAMPVPAAGVGAFPAMGMVPPVMPPAMAQVAGFGPVAPGVPDQAGGTGAFGAAGDGQNGADGGGPGAGQEGGPGAAGRLPGGRNPALSLISAHLQLRQDMENNLRKLRQVISESQAIAQQMEQLLAATSQWNGADSGRAQGQQGQGRQGGESGLGGGAGDGGPGGQGSGGDGGRNADPNSRGASQPVAGAADGGHRRPAPSR